MESRLPKPKFGIKKPINGTNASASSNSSLQVPKSSTTSTTLLKDLGKSKTVISDDPPKVNRKENKPPVSQPPLARAKTMASMIRKNTSTQAEPMTTRAAVKRPGTSTNPIPPKRPAVRPLPKTGGINAGSSSVSNNTGVSGKSLKTAGVKAAPTKAVSKWDWKGRFEIVNSELSSLKGKNKELNEQRDELQSIVDEFQEKEDTCSQRIVDLEADNIKLNEELTLVKKDMIEITETNKKIESELMETKESLEKATASLKEYRELCSKQSKTIDENSDKLKDLEVTLESKTKTINELTERVKDLQSLCHEMDKDRRVLHNTIQEMKGNIRVFCRVRPRISKESSKTLCAINYIDESTLEIGRADGSDSMSCSGKIRGVKQEFSFDKVFPPTASQAAVFEELSMLVQSALEGYNVCVFAYGQTGSGKTYTMEGTNDRELEGMIPRTVRHIFDQMKEFELLGWEYKIEASFLEIYNEHIVDLLDFNQKTHDIRMADPKGNDLYVTNLQVEEIHSPEELHQCLRIAQQNRAVAATKSNERSSRSHSVARIRLIGTHAEKEEMSIGNLNLVDLAGSERLKNEEAARTAETKNINKSLANLGNVILALLKKQDHIPYRNSKLTHLLMPSLGGNSKTLMLLNVSPLDDCYNETLNSLRFASNVNNCKLGNVKRSKTMLQNPNNSSNNNLQA
ncbi:protein claret segregational [Microplitis mediator]|uniref:protein claret segregational n=1 Tax=Microplitis mediator TaxID=375433 RepID=UPI002554CE46|nr:protein claret segregational [Microplitis mediator]